MGGRGVRIIGAGLLILGAAFCVRSTVFAASTDDLSQLQQSIAEKKASIDALNTQLDSYRRKITDLAGKSASLQNDIALLENETAMAELDLASTQNSIDQETLELRIIDGQIKDTETELTQRRSMLAGLLFALNKNDSQGVLEMVLSSGNISDVFDAAQQLESVNDDMKSALEATKLTRATLADRQSSHEQKVSDLAASAELLKKKADDLELHKNAKLVIASATQDSENQYRTLMSELRAEQQSITNEVLSLQGTLQDKLNAHDSDSTGETTFTWPIHGIITTLFHDPSYPFTSLVGQHSGLDIAVPQGTAIEAAAPGYIGRVYKGQQYGYYVLLIHANGFATLYAHMSRIDVEQDQYVARGQVIGLSGGRPGTVGAGFSTGPHVHFEVRLNGIPVNPLPYLPAE
ncbi:MAG: peptidoglycan DD-metalloendopeptidase family protein [Patescibacteria group bacterium]